MKNFKTFSFVLAAVIFAGFMACSGGANKEVKEEVKEEVVEEVVVETEMVSDSTAVVDSAMIEAPVSEEVEVEEAE